MDTSAYRSDCTDHFRTAQDRTIDFSDTTGRKFQTFTNVPWGKSRGAYSAKANQHELLPRSLADQFWIYTKGIGEGGNFLFDESPRLLATWAPRFTVCLNPEIQPSCHRKIAYTSRPTQTTIASAQIK